uniref:Uncharacterized protein n=1 Tax=Naja naja TaxID=35670 RepID=A0A8C6XP25_NAJNA
RNRTEFTPHLVRIHHTGRGGKLPTITASPYLLAGSSTLPTEPRGGGGEGEEEEEKEGAARGGETATTTTTVYVCLYVCVCVRGRERARESENEGKASVSALLLQFFLTRTNQPSLFFFFLNYTIQIPNRRPPPISSFRDFYFYFKKRGQEKKMSVCFVETDQDSVALKAFQKMSSDRQRSDDESPSTSSGSSDADQRDPPAPEPEEQEERKPSATQQKKNTKLSSKTTAKLSTSAKRIQKELAEITLDPPPNCSATDPLGWAGELCGVIKLHEEQQLFFSFSEKKKSK